MIVVHSVRPYRDIEVYWGVEYDCPVYTPRISHAWLVEDLEPYRRSTWGGRIRFGSRALHFGRCIRGEDPHRRLGDIEEVEIRKWRSPHAQEEEAPAAGAEPPGRVEPDGPVQLAGSAHDERLPPVQDVPAVR